MGRVPDGNQISNQFNKQPKGVHTKSQVDEKYISPFNHSTSELQLQLKSHLSLEGGTSALHIVTFVYPGSKLQQLLKKGPLSCNVSTLNSSITEQVFGKLSSLYAGYLCIPASCDQREAELMYSMWLDCPGCINYQITCSYQTKCPPLGNSL